MLETFRKANFEALAGLWNQFYPAAYKIDPEVLELHTVKSPVFDWGASFIEMDGDEVKGFVAVKRPLARIGGSYDQDQAHICSLAHDDVNIGIDLLAETKNTLRNRGVSTLVFGKDLGHFFPGSPIECPKLNNFLVIEGFMRGGELYDLELDLSMHKFAAEPVIEATIRPLEESDLADMKKFFRKEFPTGRWEYEVSNKIAVEEHPQCVLGLFVADKIEGFALMQDYHCKLPIGGCVWRCQMGKHYGAVGPIGIAERLRGKGLGSALLSGALKVLKDRGVTHCMVDWTDLVPFYAKHGFQTCHTYRTMELDLA